MTGIVIFVTDEVMLTLVYGLWLAPKYWSLVGEVWRPQAELCAKVWIMQSTTFVFCFVFASLFARGYRGGGWREGVWFGLVASLVYRPGAPRPDTPAE